MARYTKVFPLKDDPANSFAKVQRYLTDNKFKYTDHFGEQLFQKGDGFMVVAQIVKVVYFGDRVRLEAWVNNSGAEMDLEGFMSSVPKKKLKKIVEQVELILQTPAPGYVPAAAQAAAYTQSSLADQTQAAPHAQNSLAEEPRQYSAPQPAAAPSAGFCSRCGAALAPGGAFCPQCGLGAGEQVATQSHMPAGTGKREYYKNYAGDTFRRQLKSSAIMCYICAGLTALVAILLNPLSLLDAAIVLGLGLGMHLGKSKVCAYLILIYSALSTLITLVATGTFGGWLLILAGVFAVSTFSKADKRYKELTGK